MASHKLDIFETLAAIDQHDTEYYENLSADEKKGFAAPVVLRWTSAVNDSDLSEFYLLNVNERANKNFWDIYDHPELQYKLLASCGVGSKKRHQWVPMVGKRRKSDQVRDFLSQFYTDANEMELDIILSKFNEETFTEFVNSSGMLPEEIKEVTDAYATLIGKKVKKSRK